MRLHRVRFTTRRLMIIVAIAALIASVPAMRRRANEFRQMAVYHRILIDQTSVTAAERESGSVGEAELKRLNRDLKKYHRDMIEKYEWGSRYPWLMVTSDRVKAETGGLEHGYTWFNIHCWLGSPGMQDMQWGEPKLGRCPAPHRTR